MKHFVGSKGGQGIRQWLISEMPAHTVYCEPFLGRGAVLRHKRQASVNIGIEHSQEVIQTFWRPAQPGLTILQADALTLLPLFKANRNWLVYADPPYLLSTRSCKRAYYEKEMFSEQQHWQLLTVLKAMDANVMVSGYWSELYDQLLQGWRVVSKWTVNRRGKRIQEFCWLNFHRPTVFHDVRFIGINYTRRQGIKRKIGRWEKKMLAMPLDERSAVLNALLTLVDVKRDPTAGNGCAGSTDGNDSASSQLSLPLP
jgi:DNA adenine methylase